MSELKSTLVKLCVILYIFTPYEFATKSAGLPSTLVKFNFGSLDMGPYGPQRTIKTTTTPSEVRGIAGKEG